MKPSVFTASIPSFLYEYPKTGRGTRSREQTNLAKSFKDFSFTYKGDFNNQTLTCKRIKHYKYILSKNKSTIIVLQLASNIYNKRQSTP